MTLWEEIKYKLFNSSSAINQLLWINILAFASSCLMILFFHLSGFSADPILVYLNVPADIGFLIKRPWTFITYQFMHDGPWHIFGNMLMFFYMGSILQDFLGSKKIWYVYLGGGISGAVLFLLMYNIFPVYEVQRNSFLIGASGSVMAITAAAATLVPHYEIMLFGLFRIKLRWLALGLIVLNIAAIPVANAGGGFAHLGGAFFGMLYIMFIQGRINNPFRNFFRNFNKIIPNAVKPDEKKIYREKVYSNTESKKANNRQDRRNGKPNQDEIDAILDKISNSGYDSLTKEEKEILFRASE